MEQKQSAYRKFHSTETALLKVKTDIIKAMDNQEITCLILLDLLAAFNTVDHTILLNRLKTTFGIKDTALKWIASFLIGRTQQVTIGDLGTDLGATCRKHHISYHLYADDTQLYLIFKPNRNGSKEECIHSLENCINEIREWMCMNLLKLNDGKTQFIILGTQQQLQKLSHISIRIREDLVTPVDMV